MLTATLGGLIKDYRIKKRLSQMEVSLRIGWKDTSRLSKIEQGRVGKPTRETIDKVIKALDLTDQEKGEFLLVGGYLPTEEEIKKIRQKTNQFLNSRPHPATILDFSWRVISQNKANADVYQTGSVMNKRILKEHLRVLEIIFNPDLMQNKILKGEDLKKWHMFLSEIVMQFKNEQRNRVKEKWFVSFLKSLLQNDLFRKIWTETQEISQTKLLVGKSATKQIAHPKNPKKMLSFYLFVVPILDDPRFEMEMLIPKDKETFEYYH